MKKTINDEILEMIEKRSQFLYKNSPLNSEDRYTLDIDKFYYQDQIESSLDHVDMIIRETAVFLLYRINLGKSQDSDIEKRKWLEFRDKRIMAENDADIKNIPLSWKIILEKSGVDKDLTDVLNLMLSIELNPICLDMYYEILSKQRRDHKFFLISDILKVAYPDLCANCIQLRCALSSDGVFAKNGLTVEDLEVRNDHNMYVALKEGVILEASGADMPFLIPENLVRREFPHVKIENVVLPEQIKNETSRLVKSFFENNGEGAQNEGGLSFIFFGPSGTGKTLLARALASSMNVPLLSFSPEAVREYRFRYEDILPGLFLRAKKEKAIVFIDECDDIFEAGSLESRVLLLSIEESSCITIMATNNVSSLDPALERRFNVRYKFPMPDKSARKDMWRVLLPKDCDYSKDISLNGLGEKYPFSGSQIHNALQMASRLTSKDSMNQKILTYEIIKRSAESQFSVFLNQGLFQDKGFPKKLRLRTLIMGLILLNMMLTG